MKSYRIATFGCQMNVHDSDRMHEVMQGAGFSEVESEEGADVIILNTCSVREKAEQKLRSELGKLRQGKAGHPGRVLVVAGCVAQQEGEKLLSRGLGVDLVIGPDNIRELPLLLHDLASGGLPTVRTVFDLDAPQFLTSYGAPSAPAPSERPSAVSTFVTTMKGCNERCTFCIVPTTRGPERYRPSDEILAEVRGLAERGTREVTLLGQTVNSYTDPLGCMEKPSGADPDESEFAALLRAVSKEAPSLRLRYTSPHPRHLTPSLIAAHAELPGLCRHVHLPVQSGSDRVLKRMLRRYTRAEFEARVASLKAAMKSQDGTPGVTLSTDIIVGFPGETDEDFEQTLSLIEAVGFVGVFAFKYSERPFTPALKLKNDVSEEEKSRRLARLFALSEGLTAKHLSTLVGSELEVLIEGRAKKPQAGTEATFSGRSFRNEIVHLQDDRGEQLVGEVVRVRVERSFKHSVLASLTPEAVAQAGRSAPKQRGARRLPMLSAAD